ncbi:MAG: hypothetical protein IPN76_26590 [Saprospiraceae bacterium]|nr:hypothetical protein [Saprospiraceae bacterium]
MACPEPFLFSALSAAAMAADTEVSPKGANGWADDVAAGAAVAYPGIG